MSEVIVDDVRPGSSVKIRIFVTREGRFCIAPGDEDRWFISRSYLAPPGPYLHFAKQDARDKFLDEAQRRLGDGSLTWTLAWEDEDGDGRYALETFSYFCGLPQRILLYSYYTDSL